MKRRGLMTKVAGSIFAGICVLLGKEIEAGDNKLGDLYYYSFPVNNFIYPYDRDKQKKERIMFANALLEIRKHEVQREIEFHSRMGCVIQGIVYFTGKYDIEKFKRDGCKLRDSICTNNLYKSYKNVVVEKYIEGMKINSFSDEDV